MKKAIPLNIAYDYIRKAVLNGEYTPGQPLLEAELAQKTGVSRTPVRQALRQLESEGLITIRTNLGAVVKSMTMKEYREMSEVRQALESGAAGLAALHRTDADLKAILLIGNWIFRGIGSERGLRGGYWVETESDPCSPPTLKSG